MREQCWLTNLCRKLGASPRTGGRYHRVRSNTPLPAIETLESRKLLSSGSVTPVGVETQVNTFTNNSQRLPDTAMDSHGNFVVTWSSYFGDGNNEGIFAQRYNAAGAKQGGEFLVNTYTTGIQRTPAVAMDATGDFVIAWVSVGQDGSGAGVFAQRYNAAGVAQGAEFRVNGYTTSDQDSAKIAMDSAGNFVVTWQSKGQDGSGYGVYARRYNSAGVAQSNNFQVNPITANDEVRPDVAMDSSGDFIVTWLQYNTTPFNFFVESRRYNAAGVAQGGPVEATSAVSLSSQPVVAMDSTGDFAVAWAEEIYEGIDPKSYGVYAQRYNAQSAPQGNVFLVNTTLTNNQLSPSIAMDAIGNFLVTWSSFDQDGSDFGVYGQAFNSAGVRQGNEFQVNTYTTARQQLSQVALDSAGDVVIAYSSYYQDGNADGVFARRYKLVAIPPNHAPVGTPKTVTTLEDTSFVFTTGNFGFSDPNDNPANALLSVKISTLPSTGTLTNNNVAVTAGSSVLATDINSGKLKFTPAANSNGATASSFKFQVKDNGGLANGGADTDPTPRTMTIAVTSVNDAPVGTAATVTTLEDKPYVFKTADFGFTDPNDVPANNLLAVKIKTLPAVGSLTNNGVAVTAGSTVVAADITGGKLKYTPPLNKNGAALSSFTFQVKDNGGTANGGIDTDVSARKMTLAVTSVNDAPVGNAATVTTLEDKPYIFLTADFGFADPNDVPANSRKAVKITTVPSVGTLTDNGVAVAAGAFIPIADISGLKLKYTPPVNKNGTALSSFTFQVQDNGGTANGGIDTDVTARKMTIAVTSVNDAPLGTSKTISMARNTTLTLSVANFGFTDPSDSPANTLLAVKILSLPISGALKLNGVAVTAGQFISVADLTAGKLKYTPKTNAAGNGIGSFNFKVQDDGGTANGGIDLDTGIRKLTINVT